MIKFILHTVLILVVTQLGNVTMRLVTTEREQAQLVYFLTQVENIITGDSAFHDNNLIITPILPNEAIRLKTDHLPAKVRIMLKGVMLREQEEINVANITPGERPLALAVWDAKSRFHKLRRLLI